MFFVVESANALPIYDQIVRQVTFAVAKGLLPPGDRIPSVRDLAKQLAVNPNTVARAYRELQTSGVVEPLRGMGMEVAAAAVDACRRERLRLVRERLRGVLEEAHSSGLSDAEIRNLVDEEMDASRASQNGAAK